MRVGKMTIDATEGDITDQATDAIVNAANNHLWMGGGVAGAIKRLGGQQIEDEAVALGPIPVGEAVVTGAGRLKARYVIHAAGMGQDLRTSAEIIRTVILNALARAAEHGMTSVAFPTIGTGVGGFPLAESARIMLDAAIEHVHADTSVTHLRFVLFGEDAYRTVAELLIARDAEGA